jgi:ribosomal protein S18 acetylase RimI-like enzyme
MKAAEFPLYVTYFIAEYAKEITQNYGYSIEKGLALAEQDIKNDLSEGVATPNNYLLCIELYQGIKSELIGYLWYGLRDEGKTAFILDFYLLEQFQGQGHGKAALMALEQQLAHSSVEQIKLRVAYDNKHALGLYEKTGFNITGYNMVKIIKNN